MKATMRKASFGIPDRSEFRSYRGGSVEVGVYPPFVGMVSILDREGGLEELKDWTVNNILMGFIEGDYAEEELREEEICIRVSTADGKVVLDTFGWKDQIVSREDR